MAALPCKLAWSVHAAEDPLRLLLVPTTRHKMVELRDTFRSALADRPSHKMRALLVEVALIGGVNDQLHHAQELARFLAAFARDEVLVNLIPYNENGLGLPGADGLFHAPAMEDVHAFQRALWDQGMLCTVRATKGEDERSACGQLATATRKDMASTPARAH